MDRKMRAGLVGLFALLFISGSFLNAEAQIEGQFAQDFVAGTVPSQEEIDELEKAVAAAPGDLRLTRKLAKGYFFQFFGEGNAGAVPKAERMFERALEIKSDDAESLVYFGSLHILKGRRLEKSDTEKQKKSYDRGFELVQRAEKLAPRHGAVVAVASASYLFLPDSYGMAPHVVEMLEGLRKAMGPMFKRFSHHGHQRLLITLGQAYARTGEKEKARAAFDEALKVNESSLEGGLARAEIGRLEN